MSTKYDGIQSLEKRFGKMTLGMFIRSLREADGISQTAFAEKLGISRANLCDIEKGRKPVSINRAAKLAKKLQIATKVFVQLAIQDEIRQAKLPLKVEVKVA